MKALKSLVFPALALAAAGLAQTAMAANLVANGDFESTTAGNGQLGFNTDATGWFSAPPSGSYNFVFAPGTADTSGAVSQFGGLSLWGPGNGSANGLPAASPSGGNFVAMDGAFDVGPITQTITGLVPGKTYALSFWWGGAQQSGFSGATTDQLQVSLGAQTISTSVINVADHGFTGWMQETFSYTATSPSELLSFLAIGTPSGVPPFALLDGVALNQTSVPDSNSTVMLLGLAGVVLVIAAPRLRRQH